MYELSAQDLPLNKIGTALGTTAAAAHSCLNDYLNP